MAACTKKSDRLWGEGNVTIHIAQIRLFGRIGWDSKRDTDRLGKPLFARLRVGIDSVAFPYPLMETLFSQTVSLSPVIARPARRAVLNLKRWDVVWHSRRRARKIKSFEAEGVEEMVDQMQLYD